MSFSVGLIFTPQIVDTVSRSLHQHLSVFQIGLVSGFPSIVGAVVYWLWLSSSDRKSERHWHAMTALILAEIGFALLLSRHGLVPALCGLALVSAGAGSAATCLWQIAGLGISGRNAAIVFGYVNCYGIIGSIISPYLVGHLKDITGSYSPGLFCLAVIIAVGFVCLLVLKLNPTGKKTALS